MFLIMIVRIKINIWKMEKTTDSNSTGILKSIFWELDKGNKS